MKIKVAASIIMLVTSVLGHTVNADCFTKVDEAKLKDSINSINQFYGDVPPTVNCKKPANKAEQLICSSGILSSMEELDRKAYVYAIENGTKQEVDHKKTKSVQWIRDVRNKCKDELCLCEAFQERIDANLGGESPYSQ